MQGAENAQVHVFPFFAIIGKTNGKNLSLIFMIMML